MLVSSFGENWMIEYEKQFLVHVECWRDKETTEEKKKIPDSGAKPKWIMN